MAASTTESGRRAPARATIRSVVVAGLGTYRRRFGRIVLAALVVFAPIDLVVTLATEAAKHVAEKADVLSVVVSLSSSAVGVAGTTLSLVLFAGVIDRIVAVDQRGANDLPLRDILRGLPTTRLVLAGTLATALILAGLLLFLVPGFILMVLFSVVGPLVVIERLGVWASLRRSAQLVWPHFLLAFIVVLIPTVLEEELTSSLETFRWYDSPFVHLPIDVASTIFIGGLIGVVEVTLAHALIADAKRRRGDGDRLQKTGASSDERGRRTGSAAESGAPAAQFTAPREEP
ncbi:MAG: hypothetical protein NTW58_01320 [Actinobacteria bacterium]|nr:hypothetical protein [Actinomycetota bacterium]